MAFDESLADRIRTALGRKKGVEEKTLFGCFCLLLNGNVLVGVWKKSLLVRLGHEQGEDALLEPHVRPFDITGKAMKGWVVVAPEGICDDEQLGQWIRRAVKFVGTLPAK
jgi:hypothetical protein